MRKLTNVLLTLMIVGMFACSEQPAEETSKTFDNVDALVEAVHDQVNHMTVDSLNTLMEEGETFLLVDVRGQAEYEYSSIPGAVWIPRGVLEFRIAKDSFWDEAMLYKPEKDEMIILHCKKGHRGTLAAQSLETMGYTNVYNLEGGFDAWKKAYPSKVDVNKVVHDEEEGEEKAAAAPGGC